MLNYISNLLNSVLYSIFSFDKLFNKSFRNNTNNTNVTYSFYFKNFFAHSKTLFVNIWSLQKVNYLTLHTASAGR